MMRLLLAAALLAATPLAATPLARADAGAEAARSYRLETTGTTERLEVGERGVLVLSIVPVEKVHVDPRAPLKVTLEATPGIRLEKTSLGKADPVDPQAEGRRFEVPFVAEKPGMHQAKAKLDFFVCSDEWCVKQVRDVTVAVDVK